MKKKGSPEPAAKAAGKVSLFDILNNITGSRDKSLVTDEYMKAYTPFMMNRFLMQRRSTIEAAALANMESISDKRIHHDFLMGMELKFYRGKWTKEVKQDYEDYIPLVQEAYGVSKQRAHEYCKILSAEELELVKASLYTGGADATKKKRSKA